MTNNYLNNMFQIPLLHVEVSKWAEKKKKLIDLFNSLNVGYDQTVWTNYHTDLTPLNETIQDILKEDIDKFNDSFQCSSIIGDSWFEKALKSDFHLPHNHGPFGFSAVCYVKYDNKVHTPTEFVGPFSNFIDGCTLTHIPQVKEGSLIFFPASILHFTRPNTSNKERIVLSFNLKITGTN